MKNVVGSLIILTICFGFAACTQPVTTFVEAEDPVALTLAQSAQWDELGGELYAAWGDSDFAYSRSVVPSEVSTDPFRLTVWKGERASALAMMWSAEAKVGVECEIGNFTSEVAQLPASIASAHFVRYTLADQQTPEFMKTHRYKKDKTPAVLAPDMLDTLARFDMDARTARPVWISISIPQDAMAGIYKAEVEFTSGCDKVVLPLELEVVNHTLQTPDKWSYHLDLWQHPSAVARAYGVELWSDAHFKAMKPLMKRLADAGQKVVTATLNKDPWNHQCYDAYEPMITWTKHMDGTWSYDYQIFDKWVQFMLDLGINREINCYSMVPWNCELEYMDEAEGKVITVKAEPGTEIFTELWTPFLIDFKKHLQAKGWLEIANIAMDERSPEAMQAAADVLMACAPEMGFALADNHRSYKKFTMMRDVCVAIHHSVVSQEDINMRREQGFYTTFYVCCHPSFPNTFSTSQPYESELLGWYNIAHDYDGMLRWAYNSWAEDPQYDSRFGKWISGDTYLVYPFNRSSVRFEKLIDGIEVAEKVRQLRRDGVDVSEVEAVFEKICGAEITDYTLPWHEIMLEARKALDEVSRR